MYLFLNIFLFHVMHGPKEYKLILQLLLPPCTKNATSKKAAYLYMKMTIFASCSCFSYNYAEICFFLANKMNASLAHVSFICKEGGGWGIFKGHASFPQFLECNYITGVSTHKRVKVKLYSKDMKNQSLISLWKHYRVVDTVYLFYCFAEL